MKVRPDDDRSIGSVRETFDYTDGATYLFIQSNEDDSLTTFSFIVTDEFKMKKK